MRVQDIGEFQLIDMLAGAIEDDNFKLMDSLGKEGFRVRLGIGDDAAAWQAPGGIEVLTADTLVEDVHFDLRRTGWRDLGWKAMAVNLSDVAAMGCRPICGLVTLGLRPDLPAEGMIEMYRGILDACRCYGGSILGGDIVRSPAFFVSVTLEGTAAGSKGRLLTRSAAMAGDKIAVTGHLGCAAAGLRARSGGLRLDGAAADHFRESQNRPKPRVVEGLALVEHGVAAAMDVSDGLVDDLEKLCKASGVGAVIHAEELPADDLLKAAFPGSWLGLSLGGGEDYELIFTAPQAVLDEAIPMLRTPVSVIGDIVDGPPKVQVMDGKGTAVPVADGGWDHLRAT